MKSINLRTSLLLALVLAATLSACSKPPAAAVTPATEEAVIRTRYSQMMTAVCRDSFADAVAVVDPETRANEGKSKLIFGAGRLLVGLAQLKSEDFRVDRVEFGENGTNAQVYASVFRDAKWNPEPNAGQWVRLTNVWYAKY